MSPLLFLALALPLAAQEAPAPELDLIGSVTQKVSANAPAWDVASGTAWAFTADLAPRFTFGPVVFLASSTWTLPLTANLTAGTPTVVVPEAFFRVTPVEGLDLTFGQKRFNLGVGQTFTVGDSLNPVIGFFDQKTGFRGATAEWSPVSWASVAAAASTEGGTADAPVTLAAQGVVLVDKVQVTASVVGRKDKTFNPALGLSYDWAGIVFTAEGAAEFLPQGKRPSAALQSAWTAPEPWTAPALSASAGARYTVTVWDVDLTLSGEYLHWAQGWTTGETDSWKGAFASVSPPVKGAALAVRSALPLRSQENAFFRLALGGSDLGLSGFAAVDLQDRSFLTQGAFTWTPWDNLDLAATLQAVSGQTGTSWEFLNPNKDRYQASFATTYHF